MPVRFGLWEFKTLSNQLEKIQRRAIRWAYKIHKFDSVSDTMHGHNITSLFDIAFLRRLAFGDYQLKLSNYIAGNTAHNTRRGTINPHFRTNVFKNPYYNRIRGEIKLYLYFVHCPVQFTNKYNLKK